MKPDKDPCLLPFTMPLSPTVAHMARAEQVARLISALALGVRDSQLEIARAIAEGAQKERETFNLDVVHPRAHTYGSENADIYRAWDCGFEAGVDACRASLRAHNRSRAEAGDKP